MKGFNDVTNVIQANNKKRIIILFAVLLLIDIFMPSFLAYISNVTVFMYFVLSYKGKIPFLIYGMKYIYLIVLLGLLIGAIELLLGRFETRDYIRDIYYFTNPIFVIMVGAYIRKKCKDDVQFFNTILLVAGIQAAFYLCNAGLIVVREGLNFSFRNWRITFGDSNPIAATAVFILLIDGKKLLTSINKKLRVAIFVLCIVEIVFSMSRTNIYLVLITTFYVAFRRGVFKNVKKWFKYLVLAVLIIFLAVLFLGRTDAITAFINKTLSSFSEINNTLDWTNASVIQGNWRGYETYSALVQFRNYSFLHQLIGYGFGERIEVGIYANKYLNILNSDGSAATTIPVLHNGYSTILCKLGLSGIILYLMFYVSLLRTGMKKKNNCVYSEILVAIVLAMIGETYVLNGLFREVINFPFVYMIGYLGYSIMTEGSNYVHD